MRGFAPCIIAALLLAGGTARALEPRYSLDAAAGGAYARWQQLGERKEDWPAYARLRLGMKAAEGEAFLAETAYEAAGFWGGASAGAANGPGKTPRLRIADLPDTLGDGKNPTLAQNLDRLNGQLRTGETTLVAGRQAIGHGSGRFFNPSDIFAPLTPQGVYSEYKSGVDALRLSKAFGEDAEAELICVAHQDGAEESYYLARGRLHAEGVDLSAYAGSTLGAATAALDLSFDRFGAGWYLDSVARLDRPLAEGLRVAAGAHRRIFTDTNAFVEFHWNGPGHQEPSEAAETTKTPEWKNREIFVTARRYAVIEADYAPHPLVTVAATWLVNADDGSSLLLPSLDWSATESVSLRLGASVGLGPGPNRKGLPRSEFGSYPDLVFAEARINL